MLTKEGKIIRFLIRYIGRLISLFILTGVLLYLTATYIPSTLSVIYWGSIILITLLLIYSIYLLSVKRKG